MKLIIFDADGTLRKTKSGAWFPLYRNDWRLKPGVMEYFSVKRLDIRYGIASNQSGVGCGHVSISEAHGALKDLAKKLNIPLNAVKMEISADSRHPRRKPNPGMILEIIELYRADFDIESVLFVGDRKADEQAAAAAGVSFCAAEDFLFRNGFRYGKGRK